MKPILIVFLFCGSMLFSFGQGRVSLGGEVGFPTGSSSNGVGTGLGGWVRFESGVAKKITWTASLGYLRFPTAQSLGLPSPTYSGYPPLVVAYNLNGNSSFVPVLIGAKFYPKGSFSGFYFGADLGITAVSFKGTMSSAGYSESVSESSHKPTLVPTLGIHTRKIDFGFRYNLIESASYFGARLGVVLD